MPKELLKNVELGEAGEKEVASLLEKVFFGHANRFMGLADLGRDIHLEFRSSALRQRPLDVLVQVKTGSSYIEDCGRYWRIHNIDERRFSEWCISRPPVILVWVYAETHHDTVTYWKLFSTGHFC